MAILNGTHKADTLTGTAQNDSIFADNGNDIINGGAGDDQDARSAEIGRRRVVEHRHRS